MCTHTRTQVDHFWVLYCSSLYENHTILITVPLLKKSWNLIVQILFWTFLAFKFYVNFEIVLLISIYSQQLLGFLLMLCWIFKSTCRKLTSLWYQVFQFTNMLNPLIYLGLFFFTYFNNVISFPSEGLKNLLLYLYWTIWCFMLF